MARRVGVAALLTLGFGGALCVASARDCVEPVVVEENTVKTVYNNNNEEKKHGNMSASLYVKPGGNFRAVCVKSGTAEVDREKDCFPAADLDLDSAAWNLLTLEATVLDGYFFGSYVDVHLKVGSGVKEKRMKTGILGFSKDLSVLADGASQWLTTGGPSDACPDLTAPENQEDSVHVEDPEAPKLLLTVMTVMMWVMVVTMMAAVAVTVLVWKLTAKILNLTNNREE